MNYLGCIAKQHGIFWDNICLKFRYNLEACSTSKMNQMKQNKENENETAVNPTDAYNWYIVHIQLASGSISAYHGIGNHIKISPLH